MCAPVISMANKLCKSDVPNARYLSVCNAYSFLAIFFLFIHVAVAVCTAAGPLFTFGRYATRAMDAMPRRPVGRLPLCDARFKEHDIFSSSLFRNKNKQ